MLSNQDISNTRFDTNHKRNFKEIILESIVLFYLPLMTVFTFVLLSFIGGFIQGIAGRNGGLTDFFQIIGLYPHQIFIIFLWVVGIGVMLAFMGSILPIMTVLAGVLQKNKYGAMVVGKVTSWHQRIIQFAKDHRHITSAIVFGVAVGIALIIQPIHWTKTAAPSATTKQTYSRVLMALPNMRHAISGDAQVKQVGAHTYWVKMVPDHR